MAAVSFFHHKEYDRDAAQTVEESIRAFANWAGIHKHQFYNTFASDSVGLLGAGLSGEWSIGELTDNAPYNLLVEYHTDALGHGATLRGDTAGNFTLFVLTESSRLQCYYYEAATSTYITLLDEPVDAPAEGDVVIAMREMRLSDLENDFWVGFSMWINDKLIDTAVVYWGSQMKSNLSVGLAIQGFGPRFLTNVRIPQLSDYSEWSSLDPGEYPGGGMQRILEGRYVKYSSRYDGSLKAWRSEPIGPAESFPEQEIYTYQSPSFDKRQLATHIRMMGAYEWSESVNMGLVAKYGHKFEEVSNPYLMTENDCYRQAQREILRRLEASFTEAFEGPMRPLLETDDRIEMPNGSRLLTKTGLEFQPGLIKARYITRLYTYED